MNFEHKFMDFAVYWPPGTPGKGGQLSFGDAVEIRCFWEGNVGETPIQAKRQDGTLWTPKSIVSSDFRMEEQGYLWHGRFRDLKDKDDPRKNKDSAKIEVVADYRNKRNTSVLYTGYV